MRSSDLVKNIAALSSVQLLNYLLPLLTLPYVTRVLGVESWGRVAMVQFVVTNLVLIVNWGFGYSATRKISANRANRQFVSDTLLTVWAAQMLLCVLAIAILLTLIEFVPFIHESASYFYWGIGMLVGVALTPVWFANGIERIKELAAIQVMSKVLTLPLIFLLIRTEGDGGMMLAINVIASLCAAAMIYLLIIRPVEMSWKLPSIDAILKEMKEGASIFLSTLWISLYTTLIPIMLGAVAGAREVGYYALADRARQLSQSAMTPVSQALFPRLSYLFSESKGQAVWLLKKSAFFMIVFSAVVSAGLWVSADYLVHIVAGSEFSKSADVLRLLAPLPLVISISNIVGIQIMIPNHRTSAFNMILALAGMVSLVLMYPLISSYGSVGAASNVLCVEILVTGCMVIYLWRHKSSLLKL